MDLAFTDYGRFVLALVLVIGLILLLAAAARKLGYGYQGRQLRGQAHRLAVVESLLIDSRRRLVLVRRDSTEHQILLGSGPDLLVETGIVPPPGTTDPTGAKASNP